MKNDPRTDREVMIDNHTVDLWNTALSMNDLNQNDQEIVTELTLINY